MTAKESLERVLAVLPEEHLRELLDFAEFLSWRDERTEWQQFGKAQLSKAYGPNEAEYSRGDLKPEVSP